MPFNPKVPCGTLNIGFETKTEGLSLASILYITGESRGNKKKAEDKSPCLFVINTLLSFDYPIKFIVLAAESF